MKTIATLILGVMIHGTALADDNLPLFPQVEIKTSQGNIVVELDGRRAPITVQNFLQYAREKHYDGTIFHRVIAGFVAQSGGFDKAMKEKKTRENIPNESGNGRRNLRGTIAMARTSHPHSATSQFYFNLSDNRNLDPNPSRWGYCVFGQVVEGMETLDRIAAIPTGSSGPFGGDFPQTTVTIESIKLIEAEQATSQ